MNISGSGQISAGEYNERISVSGSGKATGNVRAIGFSCSGSAVCEGYLECTEDVKVSGSMKVEGALTAEVLKVSGALKVGGECRVGEIKISGSLKCEKGVKAAVIKCSGGLSAGGDVEAEEIRIAGAIKCSGLLNGEKIDISIGGGSRVGSIGGSVINVFEEGSGGIARMPLISKLLGSKRGLAVEESVEGDIIALEYTEAPLVVGRVVAIGEGCRIGLVQYSEQLEVHPKAIVEKRERVE